MRPQSAESIAAQLLRDHRGQHVGLLAPLVVNRKGVYTDLAKWAKARGHTHLRVDGEFVPVDPWPRLDRFKEHTLELPVGDLVVDAGATRPSCARCWRKALDARQGRDAPAGAARRPARRDGSPARRRRASARSRCSRPSAPARPAAPATPSSTRACSATTASTAGARTCVGTGLALTREQRKAYDDSVRDDDDKGREQSFPSEEPEVEGVADERLPRLRRHAPERRRRARVTFDGQSIARIAQWSVSDARRWVEALPLAGRDAEIARDVVSEIRSRLEFLEEVGLGYLTLDRAAPTLSRRRGAAHPPGGAARQQPAGRVLRARRADHRPAPARQPHPARRAATSSATRATRWSSSSTTRTPSAAPTTSSTSAPAPASAAAAWSPRAASARPRRATPIR